MAGNPLELLLKVNVTSQQGVANLRAVGDAFQRIRGAFFGLSEVGRGLQDFGRGITALGMGTLNVMGGMISSAADLDDAMVKVAAITGKSSDSVGHLREEFLKMSNVLPISAAALGEVAVNAARAGISSEDAIKKVSLISTKLASVSGEMSEVASSTALIQMANNFEDASKEGLKLVEIIPRLADALAAVSLAGPGTVKQLADIGKRAASGARLIGVTETQLVGLSGAVLSMGATPEVAGTALTNFFTKMAQDSEKFAKAAGLTKEELSALLEEGRGIEAVTGVFAGLSTEMAAFTKATGISHNEVAKMLAKAKAGAEIDATLGKLSDNKRAIVDLAGAFKDLGIRGARSGRVLLSMGLQINKITRFQQAAAGSAGELDRIYQQFVQSFKQQLKTLRGSIENIAIAFGTVLLPILNAIIFVLLKFTALIIALPTPIKLLISLSAILAGVLLVLAGSLVFLAGSLLVGIAMFGFLYLGILGVGVALGITGQNVKDYAQDIKGAMVSTFFWNMQLRKTKLALQGVGRAIPSRQMIGTWAKNFPGMLKKGFGKGLSGLKSLFKDPKAFLGTLVSSIPILGPILTAMGPALAGIGAALLPITLAIAGMVAFILIFKDEINAVFSSAIGMGKEFFGIFSEIASSIGAVFNADGIGGGSLMTGLKILTAVLFPALIPLIVLLRVLPTIFKTIGAVLKGLGKGFAAVIAPLFVPISRFIRGIKELVTRVSEFFSELFGFSDGSSIFDKLASGIEFLVKLIVGPFSFALRVVLDVFLGLIGGLIEGFFIVFLEPMADGLQEIVGIFRESWDEIAAAFEPITKAFNELAGELGFAEEGFDIFGIVVQGVAFMFRFLFTYIIPVIPVLKVFVKLLVLLVKAFAWMVSVGAMLVEKFLAPFVIGLQQVKSLFADGSNLGRDFSDGIKTGLVKIADAFTKAFDPIIDFITLLIAAPFMVKDSINSAFNAIGGFGGSVLRAVIPGGQFLPGGNAKLPGLATGGITLRDTPAQLHKGEVVAPLTKLPGLLAQAQQRSGASVSASSSSGAPVNLSLNIPVQLSLDGMLLGEALVKVSDEQVRQQLGTRSVRLAGI